MIVLISYCLNFQVVR